MKYKKIIKRRLEKFIRKHPKGKRRNECPFDGLKNIHKYCAEMFPDWAKSYTRKDFMTEKIHLTPSELPTSCPCDTISIPYVRKTVNQLIKGD